jgi:hypothetical protein
MTEGGKKAIKKTGDHNWDMERMQCEKDQDIIFVKDVRLSESVVIPSIECP